MMLMLWLQSLGCASLHARNHDGETMQECKIVCMLPANDTWHGLATGINIDHGHQHDENQLHAYYTKE